MPKTTQILKALSQVNDPDSGQDIVSSRMVSGIQILKGGQVVFMIEVDPARGAMLEPMRQEAEKVVSKLWGVKKVSAILTAEKQSEAPNRDVQSGETPVAKSAPSKMDPHGMDKNPVLKVNAKNIIVVSSGKGGVGKSTISMGLAKCLANNSRLKVGILDADIYGPSQVILSGLTDEKPKFTDEKMIIPPRIKVQNNPYDIQVMSIGFMVDMAKALVWRGPMVQSAIYQLFRDVQWGGDDGSALDVLIVDMPPGTGDAQLTLAQKISVDGAVIVSTPQDLALADARRGVEMFNKTGVPILGLIENMSTHICSNCGHEEHIFGHGGAKEEAQKLGVPFLGEVPLSMSIRQKADAGEAFDLPDAIVDAIKQKVA